MAPETVLQYWPLLLAASFSLIWFVRLESKVLYLEQKILSQQIDQRIMLDQLWTKMESLQVMVSAAAVSLAKIEGRLETRNDPSNN